MRHYDTESMRTQLGVVRPGQPLNHRGVLALGPRSDWQSLFSDPVIPTSILNVSDTKPLKFRSPRASKAWSFKEECRTRAQSWLTRALYCLGTRSRVSTSCMSRIPVFSRTR